MASNSYLYQSTCPFGSQVVTPRTGTRAARDIAAYHAAVEKLNAAEAALGNATDKTREKLTAARDTARESVTRAAIAAKGAVKFPVGEGATVSRWNVPTDVAIAYATASESERVAIAETFGEAIITESAVHPSILATDGFREMLTANAPEGVTAGEYMLAMLADGVLIIPSTAKGASASKGRKSAEEKAREAVAVLFG